MKITYRQLLGTLILLSATAAVFGNYLWLLGLVAKPPEDLLEARWIYALIGYSVGGAIALFPEV